MEHFSSLPSSRNRIAPGRLDNVPDNHTGENSGKNLHYHSRRDGQRQFAYDFETLHGCLRASGLADVPPRFIPILL